MVTPQGPVPKFKRTSGKTIASGIFVVPETQKNCFSEPRVACEQALPSEVMVKNTRASGTREETPRPRAARFSHQNRELARAATYS